MGRYEGLDPKLKVAVFERDNWRCRWCGSTNRLAYDAHHIIYRRGEGDDRLDNLATLCRDCHNFVHDSYRIPKRTAQAILFDVIADSGAGLTGLAQWRRVRAYEENEPKEPGRFFTGASETTVRLFPGEDDGISGPFRLRP